jgi:hypothetical protein
VGKDRMGIGRERMVFWGMLSLMALISGRMEGGKMFKFGFIVILCGDMVQRVREYEGKDGMAIGRERLVFCLMQS